MYHKHSLRATHTGKGSYGIIMEVHNIYMPIAHICPCNQWYCVMLTNMPYERGAGVSEEILIETFLLSGSCYNLKTVILEFCVLICIFIS